MRPTSSLKNLNPRSWAQEFRDFIARGNVVDLTVGVAIGGAFTELVRSFTQNVVTPPVRAAQNALGDLAERGADAASGALPSGVEVPISGLGAFGQQLFAFLTVATTTFLVAKVINRFRRTLEARAQDVSPKSEAVPEEQDVNVRQIAQNERIIALLESLVAAQTKTDEKRV